MCTVPVDDDRFGRCLRLTQEDASVLVALRGGQVLSWHAGGAERLFLAAGPVAAGAAIRGGVPVIFPQFAADGPGPRHGFARSATWTAFGPPAVAGAAVAGLRLVPDAAIGAAWPHPFELELTVALRATSLELALHAHNPGSQPWPFAAALHTYLAVGGAPVPVPAVLATHPFEDRSESGDRAAAGGPLALDEETERLYRDVPRVLDWTLPAPLRMTSEGWPDLMVWNPGATKAAALPDLAPGDHRRFLCVEPLRHARLPLAAGAHWRATHRLALLP